jgi:hypothetical protein
VRLRLPIFVHVCMLVRACSCSLFVVVILFAPLKLNEVTTDEDLEIIFHRFGTIKKCQVIRDWKTNRR